MSCVMIWQTMNFKWFKTFQMKLRRLTNVIDLQEIIVTKLIHKPRQRWFYLMKFNNLSSKAFAENCYAISFCCLFDPHSSCFQVHREHSAGFVLHFRKENLQLEAVNRFMIIVSFAGTSNSFTSYPKIGDCRCCCDRRQILMWPKKSFGSTSLSKEMLSDGWRHQKYVHVHKMKSSPSGFFENFFICWRNHHCIS